MEVWKDIKNYERLYQINNKGEVNETLHTVINGNINRGELWTIKLLIQ